MYCAKHTACLFWSDINQIILQNFSHYTTLRGEFIHISWQIHIPNDPLWLICDESNVVQPACFSLWDHEQLLAHNYVVIHCYLEEETRGDSSNFCVYFCALQIAYIQQCELFEKPPPKF